VVSAKSPTLNVTVRDTKGARITHQLTRAQQQALLTTVAQYDQDGRLQERMSEAVPFETARALTRKGMFRAQGPQWILTKYGRAVRGSLRQVLLRGA